MSQNESVSFVVQLKEKEFVRFSLYSQYKAFFVMAIGITIFFIVYFFTLTDLSFLEIILLSVGVTLIVFLPVLFFAVSIKEKKEFRSNYKLREEVLCEVNSEGVTFSSNNEASLIEWNQFRTIKELKNTFLLYQTATKAIVVPKRVFYSEKDRQLFKNLFSEYMPEEKIHFQK